MSMSGSNPKVLVTGISGFVGPHLARALQAGAGADVIGVGHGEAPSELVGLLDSYIDCDLTSQSEVYKKIDLRELNAVIHLAGLSVQGQSFAEPQRFIASNSAMTIHLFELALKQKVLPRFVVVSSGSVYDNQQPMPLGESSRLGHSSPYAISKILVENLCDYYRLRGLECVVARPFTHTGPGQSIGFLIPDLARQLIDLGANKTISVGNLATRRDYSDVRDIVKAYTKLATAESLSHNLYNVCSGTPRSGEQLLSIIMDELGLAQKDVTIVVDQTKLRPSDPREIYGDNSRITTDTGWKPTFTIEQTIEDYLKFITN